MTVQSVSEDRNWRVYLAGPEVFLPDPLAAGKRKKEMCQKYGFEGIFPMDLEADIGGLSPRNAAIKIGELNEVLIKSCRATIANMTPFRGPSADVGTAYEMGFAASMGRIVCAYSNTTAPFKERTIAAMRIETLKTDDRGQVRDQDDMSIEDWGLADNLMLESGIARTGGCFVCRDVGPQDIFTSLVAFEQCLVFLRERLMRLV